MQTWLHRSKQRQRLPQSSLSARILPSKILSSQIKKSLISMHFLVLICRVSLIRILRSWLISLKSLESHEKLSATPRQLQRRNSLQLLMRLLVASTVLLATRSSTKLTKILVLKMLLSLSDLNFTLTVSSPTKV